MARQKNVPLPPSGSSVIAADITQERPKAKPKGRGCRGWLLWLVKTLGFSLLVLIGVVYFMTPKSSSSTTPTQAAGAASIATTIPTLQAANGPVILDNGSIQWLISRAEARMWAEKWTPLAGKTYLTLFGTVSNPYAQTGRVLYTQIFAKVDGTEYRPKTDVMAKMRLDLGGMDYIGPDSLTIKTGENIAVFVTFEVPATWTRIEIRLDDKTVLLIPNASMTVAQVAPTATPTLAPSLTPTITPTIATQTPVPAAPAVFDEATYIGKLSDTLLIAAGGRDVQTVRVADGRANGGERGVIIAYNTTESTTDGQVAEVADLYDAVGHAIDLNTLDVDSVSLIMGTNNTASLMMTAKAADVVAMSKATMSQADFLGSLTVTDLTTTSSNLAAATAVPTVVVQPVIVVPTSAPATENTVNTVNNVVAVSSTTYYAGSSGANLRVCTRTDCDALPKLAAGTSIVVDGTVNGDEVYPGNAIWYRVQYNGQTVYVYSGVVSSVNPATTATGGESVQTSGSSSAPVINNAPAPMTCPRSCDDARSQGYTNASQLAQQCPSLDRDKDGLACEK